MIAAWPGVIERYRAHGPGLKDPDTALESTTRPVSVPARLDAVLAQLGL